LKNITKLIRPILTGILAAIILVFILRISGILRRPGFKSTKNPYEYNLDDLKKIDPALLKWKEIQSLNIPLVKLTGICLDKQDNIYVIGDWSVIVYTDKGKQILKFDLTHKPRCISISPKNRLFIGMVDHIEIYSTQGKKIVQWEKIDSNSLIPSLAITDDFVFAADAGNRIVWKFDHEGKIIGSIGKKNPEKGIPGFVIPSPYFDVSIGYEGNLWVVNPGRHTLENYTPNGELISFWGKASQKTEGFCGCCNPSHFVVLPDGYFITSEKGLIRIKEYNQAGKLTSVVAAPDQFDDGTVNLDLAVDSEGRIVVLDPGRKKVRIFTRK